ncbi:MAG: NAD(P)H-hydrate dehydratase [Proteobacteria bacterium]|nr:NAD(P)H-hydrate dehydratase [Pseudomonadota bacterium]
MKVLTPERMAKYDEYAIKTWGIPSAVLMENAGRNMYRLMKERYLEGKHRIAIFCGRGNNGGDGFVIARYALEAGYNVRVFILCKKKDLQSDAALNMGLYASIGGNIVEIDDTFALVKRGIQHADIIIDAIFGTGLSKPVTGREKAVIEQINESGKPVIAVDIPSGIDGKTGAPLGCAVRAIHTFTFAYPKIGQILYPGAYHTGKLTIIDISIPSFIEKKIGFDGYIIDGAMLKNALKERNPWSHKGTYGHAVVIAGSPGKTGAAHMASMAALKIGAGLVTLIIPESLNNIMEVKLTEVMTYPVADNGTGCFALSSYDRIKAFVEDKDVIIIGPGLSQNQETMELVRKLYVNIDKPFIVDADGINAFQGYVGIIGKAKRNAVFTPHPGELARLTGLSTKEINEDRIGAGRQFVKETGINLVLKGARTVVFSATGDIFINPTGNPALAKGGSGDILTGFIGGCASQGCSLVESSIAGVYLHGYLADDWVVASTDMDLIAGDLLAGLGKAIQDIRDGRERVYIEKSL